MATGGKKKKDHLKRMRDLHIEMKALGLCSFEQDDAILTKPYPRFDHIFQPERLNEKTPKGDAKV